MRISDWSSDVCSSDLRAAVRAKARVFRTSLDLLLLELDARRQRVPAWCAGSRSGESMVCPELSVTALRARVCRLPDAPDRACATTDVRDKAAGDRQLGSRGRRTGMVTRPEATRGQGPRGS